MSSLLLMPSIAMLGNALANHTVVKKLDITLAYFWTMSGSHPMTVSYKDTTLFVLKRA
jgi:hypothetical protein